MDFSRREIRALLLYEFRQGRRATVASRNIARAVGADRVSAQVARRWFARFRIGDFELDDRPRSGRPPTVNVGLLEEHIEQDPQLSCQFLAEQLECSQDAVR